MPKVPFKRGQLVEYTSGPAKGTRVILTYCQGEHDGRSSWHGLIVHSTVKSWELGYRVSVTDAYARVINEA